LIQINWFEVHPDLPDSRPASDSSHLTRIDEIDDIASPDPDRCQGFFSCRVQHLLRICNRDAAPGHFSTE
jgi:hypothetical protein